MGWGKIHQDSAADHLEELCRAATKKTLERPDFEANAEVVGYLNSRHVDKQEMFNIFVRRLEQKTAQKVWLAMVLIKQVLAECPCVDAIRIDLVAFVSKVAAQPMDRNSYTLPAQQRLKSAGYDIVKAQDAKLHPQEAQQGSPTKRASPRKIPSGELAARQGASVATAAPVVSVAPPTSAKGGLSPRSSARSSVELELSPLGRAHTAESDASAGSAGESPGGPKWDAVAKRLRGDVKRAEQLVAHLQEVVLQYSGDAADGPAPRVEAALLEQSAERLRGFRARLRSALAKASRFETPEAQALLAKGLTASEALDNAMELYNTVVSAHGPAARKEGASAVGATPTAGEGQRGAQPLPTAKSLLDT